jgi:hypothetical protein
LSFDYLAKARLAAIDEALIERFVADRYKQVAPATVKLATLAASCLLRTSGS